MHRRYGKPRTMLPSSTSACFLGCLLLGGSPTAPARAAPPAIPVVPPPRGDTLLNASIRAMGGRRAFADIDSLYSRTEVVTKDGPSGLVVELWAASPDRILVRQHFPGLGVGTWGYNGRIAWELSPDAMGGEATLLDPAVVEARRSQINWLELTTTLGTDAQEIETTGRVQVGDTPCWRVRIVDQDDQEQFALLGIRDRLIVGIDRVTDPGTRGDEPSVLSMRFGDWAPVGDLYLFRSVVLELPDRDLRVTMVLTDIRINEVDDALFELPESVRSLLHAPPASDAAPPPPDVATP